MEIREKLILYKKFDEGTELSDAVGIAIEAADILLGISCEHEAALITLAVEKLIKDYIHYLEYEEHDWFHYIDLDEELYKHFTGNDHKLTEEEYNLFHK